MIKVNDKRSGFIDPAQEKRIMAERIRNRWELLPRYIRRAYGSNDEKAITKAIQKALDDGWTIDQLRDIEPPEQENTDV